MRMKIFLQGLKTKKKTSAKASPPNKENPPSKQALKKMICQPFSGHII